MLLINHGQCNQNLWKDQPAEHLPDHLNQLTFAIIVIKECWALKSFRKPLWNFENNLSKYGYIWLHISLSDTLLKVGRILIDLLFPLSILSSFLKTGLTSAYFNTVGKVELHNDLLKSWCMKKLQCLYFLWLL